MNSLQLQRIDAGKHFGIDKWTNLRRAALRLVMGHVQMKKDYWDDRYITKMCQRWRIGYAFAFYATHPELWSEMEEAK